MSDKFSANVPASPEWQSTTTTPVLSRRDQFAMAAMQAFIGRNEELNLVDVAVDAAKVADNLIEVLDRKKEPA